MLELPFPPRRSHLHAFWWTLMLITGLVVLFSAHVLASPVIVGFGGSFLVVLLVAGLIWKQIPDFVYRAWFYAQKGFARVAQIYVAALIFFVVITTAKGADGALQISGASGSMWRTYPARLTKPKEPMGSGQGWVAEFLHNARTPDRRWWLFLLPLLIVLALFRSGSASGQTPENIYTLF